MNKISIRTGPPVTDSEFYGRESELQYAWKYHISKGVSLLLSAPRRVGKTSFSKRMLKLAEENGWKTLYLNLEGRSTENDFVKFFKDELKSEKWYNKMRDVILKLFDSIKDLELAGAKISIDSTIWRSDTYGKIRQVIENAGEILIVIDELTIYLNHLLAQENGEEKVEFFLEWLRSFRQTTKSCWIFCSSVGIENFASMHQLSKHLNDVHPFPIGAFSEYEAKDFISRLDVDEKVQFTKKHIQYILNKLSWYLPYFIQIFIEKINFLVCTCNEVSSTESNQLSKKIIDEAYNLLITEKHFNTWDERLNEYREFEDNARKILKLCAFPILGMNRANLLTSLFTEKSDIEKNEVILSKLLDMLQNDGYLAMSDGKYIFRSPLLRDFWYNRFIR